MPPTNTKPVSTGERLKTRIMMVRYLKDHGHNEKLLSDELFAKAVSDETGVTISKTVISGFRESTVKTRDNYVRAIQRYLIRTGYTDPSYFMNSDNMLAIARLNESIFSKLGSKCAELPRILRFVSNEHDHLGIHVTISENSERCSSVIVELVQTGFGSELRRAATARGYTAESYDKIVCMLLDYRSGEVLQLTLSPRRILEELRDLTTSNLPLGWRAVPCAAIVSLEGYWARGRAAYELVLVGAEN